MNKEKIVEFKKIVKQFGETKALDNVSMDFYKGEVLALMGANGAGKSTLMKILSGAYERDEGEIILDGQSLPKNYSTLEAKKYGISIIYQELSLMQEMSVMENIYIGREPVKRFLIDASKMYHDAKKQLERLNVLHIDPKEKVKNLSLPEKQMVEIAKALALDCKVLVMDEPTTTLTNDEAEQLFTIINTLKQQEITVVYISHRMDEIFRVCDRAVVMRDGKLVGDIEIKESSSDELVEMMIGKRVSTNSHASCGNISQENKNCILELEEICDGKFINNLNLTVYEGEVLGIGGLVGSKRTELARMICGIDPMIKGTIKVKGRIRKISNMKQAISVGLGYLSENRKEDGLSLGMKIEENTIHCGMDKVSNKGFINWSKVRKISEQYIEQLKIKGMSTTKVVNLSGGNQQKVAIAKWLHAGCDLLIFDEPTRGIDVAAKTEIHQLIRKFAQQQGKAAIVISSEANELVSVSDRIIIMSKGCITKELMGNEIEENIVLKSITTTKGGK